MNEVKLHSDPVKAAITMEAMKLADSLWQYIEDSDLALDGMTDVAEGLYAQFAPNDLEWDEQADQQVELIEDAMYDEVLKHLAMRVIQEMLNAPKVKGKHRIKTKG